MAFNDNHYYLHSSLIMIIISLLLVARATLSRYLTWLALLGLEIKIFDERGRK